LDNWGLTSSGRKSATQTTVAPPPARAEPFSDALSCDVHPPSAVQTSRRASSSIVTIGSRMTLPLMNVTIRASASSLVSVTNPGARRV
jgi:hypothetical protein